MGTHVDRRVYRRQRAVSSPQTAEYIRMIGAEIAGRKSVMRGRCWTVWHVQARSMKLKKRCRAMAFPTRHRANARAESIDGIQKPANAASLRLGTVLRCFNQCCDSSGCCIAQEMGNLASVFGRCGLCRSGADESRGAAIFGQPADVDTRSGTGALQLSDLTLGSGGNAR
jgi:hypothetical protein